MNDTSTSPSGTEAATSLSFEQGVSAIENLLSGNPETDNPPADEAETKADEPEVVETDDEPELEIDVETDEPSQEESKAPEVTDSTLITLEDGQTISIAELKRNNLFQRDYSKKTEELARQRETLEQDYRKKAEQIEADIAQKRDVVLKLYNQIIPPKPTAAEYADDPIGLIYANQAYEEKMAQINQFFELQNVESKAQQEEREAREREFLANEQQKLYEAIPAFKSPEKLAEFRKDIQSIAVPTYDIPLEMFNGLQDHRMVRILRDAILYQKALSKVRAPKQETAPPAKPAIQPKQRMSNTDIRSRTIAEQRQTLRKTGDFDTAAKLIESLI